MSTSIASGNDTSAPTASRIALLITSGMPDYALLDSGAGRKLERFGAVLVDRPEPQAMWQQRIDVKNWLKAHAVFSGADEDDRGRWRTIRSVPAAWPVCVGSVTLLCKLSGFRHLGLFPEQLPHWQWMEDGLKPASAEPPRVLNLFAYTGAASLIAAGAGAEVAHVDASKKAVQWAKENQAASGLLAAPIRFIVEDARKFVARELRRERTYDLILVDPPKFGRGPNGEVWDLFTHLPALLRDCVPLLSRRGRLCLTVYAIRASAVVLVQLMREVLAGRPGTFEVGELALCENGSDRLLPTSLFCRWIAT